jgi:flagellin
MVTSVQTNPGSAVALQNLRATQRDLNETQDRISTGRIVDNARDNPSVYLAAQSLRSDVNGYGLVNKALDRARSVLDVTLTAGQQISDTLNQMKAIVTAAQDPSLSTVQRDALNQDFAALRDTITQVVAGARFDGDNLLDNSLPTGLDFVADPDGTTTLNLPAFDFTISAVVPAAATQVIKITALDTLSSPYSAASVNAALDASIRTVNAALASIGGTANRIEAHQTFVAKLQDTLDAGVSNLVDADLGVESARLTALQVKQQLGAETLAIANRAPEAILALFRG